MKTAKRREPVGRLTSTAHTASKARAKRRSPDATLAEMFPELAFKETGLRSTRYEAVDVVSKGHYGVVVKASDAHSAPQTRLDAPPPFKAVKLLQVQHAKRSKPVKDFLEEIAMLAQIRHEHVVRVVDWGYATCKAPETGKPTRLPYYAMDWLEATDLQKILNDETILIDNAFLEQLALQMLAAVDACQQHPKRIVHMDIKPDNILLLNVQPHKGLDLRGCSAFSFVLTDFGKAKFMFLSDDEKPEPFQTPGGAIFPYVHPRLREFLRSNRVPTDILKDHWRDFDVYSLGVVFAEVLEAIRKRNPSGQPAVKDVWDYLCADMQASGVSGAEQMVPSQGAGPFLQNLNRILFSPRTTNRQGGKQGLVRLLGQLTVDFPPDVADLVDAPEFQRLRDVPQLSFTSLVYPSATHNRFCHALGAYYFTGEYIRHLRRHPLFAYLYDEDDLLAVRRAGLLHDLGQYPFAHTFEEIGGLRQRLDVDHFRLTERILNGALKYDHFLKSPMCDIRDSWRERSHKSIADRMTDAERTRVLSVFKGTGRFSMLKAIISGPLDSDKLDYLIRDSSAAGVPYGNSLDVERFLTSLTVFSEDANHVTLGVTGKGRPAVESIMSARYHMFSEVYWHKTVRAAAAMLKEALWTGSERGIPQSDFDLAVIGFDTRRFLLWLAEKMQDERAALDLIMALCITNTRRLYKRVRTFSDAYAEEHKRQMHHRFAHELGNDYRRTTTYRDELVKLLNAEGGKTHQWQELNRHHILVDVPSSQRDQFEGVGVYFPNPRRPGDKPYYSFKEISHLCRAIYESYWRHTKKVRIYCHPDMRVQVEGLETRLDQCIDSAWNAVQ